MCDGIYKFFYDLYSTQFDDHTLNATCNSHCITVNQLPVCSDGITYSLPAELVRQIFFKWQKKCE